MILNIAQIANHCRIDNCDEDSLLLAYALAAEGYVNNYLGRTYEPDSNGDPTAPAPVQTALLLIVADLYENREASFDRARFDNPTIERLLHPYRLKLEL